MMRRLLLLPIFLFCLFGAAAFAAAAGDNASPQTRLDSIKAERARLAEVRQQLDRQLGELGRELHTLDTALAEASAARQQVADQVKDANDRLQKLERERQQLQLKVAELRGRLLDEAVAAWEHTQRSSPWMALLSGVSMSDIPNRSYMLGQVMQSQENDRLAYQQSVKQLAATEASLADQRDALTKLLAEKQRAEKQVASRVDDKRQMADRVKRDASLKAKRDAELASEEAALKKLLEDLRGGLLVTDREPASEHVRQQKGKLHWPLNGRIVASFGSHESPSRPPLNGVKIAPAGKSREVHAIAPGQVRYADWFGGYGLMMIVDHGDGVLSVYAHNDVLYKHLGDWVDAGDKLAEAGSTGWVSDVALYFEVRDAGKPVDPARWCRK